MSLKEQLSSEIKDAMRSKAKEKLTTLRMFSAAIKQKEVDERRELPEEEVQTEEPCCQRLEPWRFHVLEDQAMDDTLDLVADLYVRYTAQEDFVARKVQGIHGIMQSRLLTIKHHTITMH